MTHTRPSAKAVVNASCLECVEYSCQTDFLQFLRSASPSRRAPPSLQRMCPALSAASWRTVWVPLCSQASPSGIHKALSLGHFHLFFLVLLPGDLTINIRTSAWLPSHRLKRVTLFCLPYSSKFLDFHGSWAPLFLLQWSIVKFRVVF